MVGHGGGSGCSGGVPPSFCSRSPAPSSAHSAPRSGGANGALAAAAASLRLRPPPGLPRRLPETIVNLPGPPITPDPPPPAPRTPSSTSAHAWAFFFLFGGASWDPVRQEWLIRDSSLFCLIPIDFPLCMCLTHFFFLFVCVTCECGGARPLHGHQGARGTFPDGDAAVPAQEESSSVALLPSWAKPGKAPTPPTSPWSDFPPSPPSFQKGDGSGSPSRNPPSSAFAGAGWGGRRLCYSQGLGATSADRWVGKQPAQPLKTPTTGQTLCSLPSPLPS